MQLVEVYTLHLESAQAALARLAQVLGATVGNPSTTRACIASLGGDYQLIRVGVEREQWSRVSIKLVCRRGAGKSRVRKSCSRKPTVF